MDYTKDEAIDILLHELEEGRASAEKEGYIDSETVKKILGIYELK